MKSSSSVVIREGQLLPSKDSWRLCYDGNLTLNINLQLDWNDQRDKNRATDPTLVGHYPFLVTCAKKSAPASQVCDGKTIPANSFSADGQSDNPIHLRPSCITQHTVDNSFSSTEGSHQPEMQRPELALQMGSTKKMGSTKNRATEAPVIETREKKDAPASDGFGNRIIATEAPVIETCEKKDAPASDGFGNRSIATDTPVIETREKKDAPASDGFGNRIIATDAPVIETREKKDALASDGFGNRIIATDAPVIETRNKDAPASDGFGNRIIATDAPVIETRRKKCAPASDGFGNRIIATDAPVIETCDKKYALASDGFGNRSIPAKSSRSNRSFDNPTFLQPIFFTEHPVDNTCNSVEDSRWPDLQKTELALSLAATSCAPEAEESVPVANYRASPWLHMPSIGSWLWQARPLSKSCIAPPEIIEGSTPSACSPEVAEEISCRFQPSVGTWYTHSIGGHLQEVLRKAEMSQCISSQEREHVSVVQPRHDHPSVGTCVNLARSLNAESDSGLLPDATMNRMRACEKHADHDRPHASGLELWRVQPSIGTWAMPVRNFRILQEAKELLVKQQHTSANQAMPEGFNTESDSLSQNFDAQPDRPWNLKPWYVQQSGRPFSMSKQLPWQQRPSTATWLSTGRNFEIARKAQQVSAKAHASPNKHCIVEDQHPNPKTTNAIAPQLGRAVSSPASLFGSWSQNHARSPGQHLRSVARVVVVSQSLLHQTAPAGFWTQQKESPSRPHDFDPLALHFAAVNGDLSEVQLLLSQGADPNATDEHSIVPLHLAVDGDHEEIVDRLIAARAQVNAATVGHSPDTNAITPLHAAANRGTVSIAIHLLAANASPGCSRGDGVTPLHFVAQGGHLNMLHVLLAAKATVEAQSAGGFTPLHDAASGGHSDVVAVLLASRAPPNAEANGGTTPLHIAAQCGHQAVIAHLLAHGSLAGIASFGGFTPLHDAAHSGHLLAVSQLLQANALVDATSMDGGTALHFAAQAGHADVVSELLAFRASVDAPLGKNMLSPLHLAAKRGHIHVVRMLRRSKRMTNEVHRRQRERSRDRRGHGTNRQGSRSRSSSNSRCCGARSSQALSDPLSIAETPPSRPRSSLGCPRTKGEWV